MTPLKCANSQTAAKFFFYLARRGFAARSTPSSAPLDFLVPRCSGYQVRPEVATKSSTSICSARKLLHTQIVSRRTFTSSSSRRATICVRNPQKDEDGKAMMLEITSRAAKRLSDIMSKDGNPNLALRIQVESGGCHGFQYLMKLVTLPADDAGGASSSVIGEDDTIFQHKQEEGPPLAHEPRIILDEPSLDLLKGSKVDFTMELIGSQFKITDNPAASSSCGCGTSFDVKL